MTTRRQVLQVMAGIGASSLLPSFSFAQSRKLEKTDISISVGGKALIYYLPLTIAEVNGYFKEEGLNVTITDFSGGSKALQALVGGSVDVCSGAFEHTINLQAKKQFYRAFAMQGRTPMIVLGVSKKNMPNYQSASDLKGRKIGITAPGSSSNMLLSFFLSKHGLSANDVSIIGVGNGAGAVMALRSGQVDAICNFDPVISVLDKTSEITIIADTRTLKDTHEIFGGNMPSGCLYSSQAFIDANSNTVGALARAIVKADKWIHANSSAKIAATVPTQYLLGQPEVYELALQKSLESISIDGLVPTDGPQTALNALKVYEVSVRNASIDLSKIWTNEFVKV